MNYTNPPIPKNLETARSAQSSNFQIFKSSNDSRWTLKKNYKISTKKLRIQKICAIFACGIHINPKAILPSSQQWGGGQLTDNQVVISRNE